jgi:CPA1 family monovalent cation:H+ antiporter
MTLSAAFSYINYRFIKMPFVIGIFFLSALLSLVILSSKSWDIEHYEEIKNVIEHTDFSRIILDVMLGFLLFAGSLHTRWDHIKKQIRPVSVFAFGGVIFSTLIIGTMMYWISGLLHYPISMIYCLLFGALISPTDPIAVLGILTKAKVSTKIESTIVGESLFNDGIGVVVFIALLETLQAGAEAVNFAHFGVLFIQEAFGGLVFGFLLGMLLHKFLKSIDNYETEVLMTIAFVMAGYALSSFFHISGALAMVIMGLYVGNHKQEDAMSTRTKEYVDKFWELIDVILNSILFISIAFLLVVIHFTSSNILIGFAAIIIVLLSRIVVVYLPILIFPKFMGINKKEAKLIVWGGLRGGLSLALVLSLPPGPDKELLMIATYMVVVFSILAQGLTISKLAKRIQ